MTEKDNPFIYKPPTNDSNPIRHLLPDLEHTIPLVYRTPSHLDKRIIYNEAWVVNIVDREPVSLEPDEDDIEL